MGSPKPLLRYKGETFLDRLAGLFSTWCSPVIVVLGAGAAEIRARATRPAVFVENPGYASGMTGSLQCGLRAVPPEADGVLLTLVDHPAVGESTLAALLAGTRGVLRVPRYKGKRGHPIWFGRELLAEFLALPATVPPREVVRAHAAETEFLDLDDAGITTDIDDLEAYRKLTGADV
jgi:CTP:molybdopterin cytidylyltransferase MocA